MQLDTVITGATLIDGSGNQPVEADIGLDGEHIVSVGRFQYPPDVSVVDATGYMIAPGFIDSHTHDDGYLLAHPDMLPKVSQGVTTVVTGNCGISLAPLVRHAVPQPLDLLGPTDLFRFASFKSWIDALHAAPASVNVVPLVGHTTLRVAVMGDTSGAASPAEREAMRILLQEALEAGAFGVSTGTFYPPAAAATTDEIIDVCMPMKEQGGIYATHLRDEADQIVLAMQEALDIGRAIDCRVVFSHHKLAGEKNHGRSRETLRMIAEAAAVQPVCLDCHPYPATSTMLRLDRVRISRRTMITWCQNHPEVAGMDFSQIMDEWRLDEQETFERLSPAGAIYFLMDEEDVSRIFRFPMTMVGSDGLPFDSHPHPRQWGTFTNVLRTMVRERQLLTLQEAIHRMTGLAAENYGLHKRGLIREGYFADLVMFDPDRVADMATFEKPIRASQGIEAVWVNGVRVWDGQQTGALRPGKVLTPHRMRSSN
ncbi:MAG TPA: D-aminoacylase [Advenella sp.]|nr:D-aminoacylase [Advenella sp.]